MALISPSSLPAQAIPSSARSRQAVARAKPALQRELTALGLHWGAPLYIRIFKKSQQLEVWLFDRARFKLFKTYPICTYGFHGLGPKTKEGDGKAPEGFYFVSPSRLNPSSKYHLAFNLGYPNTYDRVHGRTGSALMVHGKCVSIGCFAMTDPVIEQIYALAHAALKQGQPFFRVHIFPFRMTDSNMARHGRSQWLPFWRNLKLGYDFFDRNGRLPPDVEVRGGQYHFGPT